MAIMADKKTIKEAKMIRSSFELETKQSQKDKLNDILEDLINDPKVYKSLEMLSRT
ncbi:hypothetical protein [Weissella koreensis]|uniref:hypothetical protein n=1 Tax=Weissella koreensis TaxID=165096 RepID=UPI0012B4B905|nr:hypothetical protein [Weissella koreensis]QGN19922.1 hypothetical protein GKC51_01080 [Weissella koreensis]